MSSVLTLEQCEILRNVASGRQMRATPGLVDLRLLQRVGLIMEGCFGTELRITEAGNRYVSFLERSEPSLSLPSLPSGPPLSQISSEAETP